MASSPRCPACGYRALRHRKRTDDFVCRRCGGAFPAAAVAENSHLATHLEEMTTALADLDVARARIDAEALTLYDRQFPRDRLVPALSLASAAIVAVVTARSLRAYRIAGAALAAAVLTFVVLVAWRTHATMKEHPLLAALVWARHMIKGGRARHGEATDIAARIVLAYLPAAESRSLLGDLERAETRVREVLHRVQARAERS